MCLSCGNSYCNGCNTSQFTQSWFNTSNLPCNECDPIVVCKRKQPSQCVLYNGPTLPNLNITTNVDSLNDILLKLDNIKQTQELKNAKLLSNINDINSRLNALEGGVAHVPYTIL